MSSLLDFSQFYSLYSKTWISVVELWFESDLRPGFQDFDSSTDSSYKDWSIDCIRTGRSELCFDQLFLHVPSCSATVATRVKSRCDSFISFTKKNNNCRAGAELHVWYVNKNHWVKDWDELRLQQMFGWWKSWLLAFRLQVFWLYWTFTSLIIQIFRHTNRIYLILIKKSVFYTSLRSHTVCPGLDIQKMIVKQLPLINI